MSNFAKKILPTSAQRKLGWGVRKPTRGEINDLRNIDDCRTLIVSIIAEKLEKYSRLSAEELRSRFNYTATGIGAGATIGGGIGALGEGIGAIPVGLVGAVIGGLIGFGIASYKNNQIIAAKNIAPRLENDTLTATINQIVNNNQELFAGFFNNGELKFNSDADKTAFRQNLAKLIQDIYKAVKKYDQNETINKCNELSDKQSYIALRQLSTFNVNQGNASTALSAKSTESNVNVASNFNPILGGQS